MKKRIKLGTIIGVIAIIAGCFTSSAISPALIIGGVFITIYYLF